MCNSFIWACIKEILNTSDHLKRAESSALFCSFRTEIPLRKHGQPKPVCILSKKIQLGVQRGTSEANDIKKEQEEKKYPFELRFYESSPLAVEDLLNGRIQAALMDELPANNAIENGRAVKKAGTHGQPDQFGVAMRKEDKELQNLVNEGYKKLMADPYWKELQKKYLSK